MISFIITFIAGISTLIGGFIPFLKVHNEERIIVSSLAFAAGIMVSISILDLLPSSFDYLISTHGFWLGIFLIIVSLVLGILTFSCLDRILSNDVDNLYRVGVFSMIAIIIHNIPEDCLCHVTYEIKAIFSYCYKKCIVKTF